MSVLSGVVARRSPPVLPKPPRRKPSGHDLEPDRVLTFKQWCELNGIAARTGRRILAGPSPPRVIQLTDRRIGIRVGDNRRWQESRMRKRNGGV
jgi:hypothetical protein